ncbi:MAG: hypothetical protein PHS62_00215 [Patescibacteria group bacterium]|nr:hypothetical protein [Patescibacteria group bacterium]
MTAVNAEDTGLQLIINNPVGGDQARICWQGEPGVAYRVLSSTSVNGPWSEVAALPTNVCTFDTTMTNSRSFFWVVKQPNLTITRAPESPDSELIVNTFEQVLAVFDVTATDAGSWVDGLPVVIYIREPNGDLMPGQVMYIRLIVDGRELCCRAVTNGLPKDFRFNPGDFTVAVGVTNKVKLTACNIGNFGGKTITVGIASGHNNVQGVIAQRAFWFSVPVAEVDGCTLRVSDDCLLLTKNPNFGDQTVAPGTRNVKLGSFVLTDNTNEGDNVGPVTVYLDPAECQAVSNLRLVDPADGVQLGSKKVVLTATNVFSNVSFCVLPLGTRVVDLYGDVATNASPGVWQACIKVDAFSVLTCRTFELTDSLQTITIGY